MLNVEIDVRNCLQDAPQKCILDIGTMVIDQCRRISQRSPMVRIIDERREELADLCRKHHVKRLEVFGSATRADFGRGSDIDLLVEFNEDVGSSRFDNFFELQRKLAELFGRAVDLVEPGGLRNPYFIRRVNETREQIYVSS